MIEDIKSMKSYSSERGIFFTPYTHWSHLNILKFYNRPWSTVEEMYEALINDWNFKQNKETMEEKKPNLKPFDLKKRPKLVSPSARGMDSYS